jgi:peptidoglycan hydrolase-like protein with peptidoglycan-binding domain
MKIIKLTESDLKKIIQKVLLKEDLPSVPAASDVPGNKVRTIQNALIKLGYNVGPTGADGKYGANTMAAVKKYQRDNGIKQTGYVGDVTAGKLGVPSMASGASKTTTGGKTQTTPAPGKTQTTPAPGKTNVQGNTGQSKVTTKDPSDIKSYPACVRFGNPTNTSKGVYKLLNNLGADFGQWQIAGTNFYEGYYFFNNGKYVSLLSNGKTGTYTCNEKGKVILDIAANASNPNTKKSGNYKYSPRIDAEVQHIKNRKMDNTPFLVYDPRENLIYLFDTGGVYITSSSVVDGADAQKGLSEAKAFTREDWCKVSGLGSSPALCTNTVVKSAAECSKLDPSKKPTWNGQYCHVQPSYGPIANMASRFLPKGIYTISGLAYNQGYTGGAKGGGKNVFSLKPIKLEGTITTAASKGLSAAIHGIPGEEGRLKASKDLETVLKADVNSGKVPPQYLDNIKAILEANKSYGCIGVPASFVNNPKVQSVIAANVNKIKVFAMGEDSQDFLAKNDDNKQFGLDDYQSTIA